MATTNHLDSAFIPRWASPPGDTILDVLASRKLGADALAQLLSVSDEVALSLIDGSVVITLGLARQLARTLGGSAEFWMTRDAQYRDDLAWVNADRWAEELPLSDMITFGWITRPTAWTERVRACLDFFGVADVDAWHREVMALQQRTLFRASETHMPRQPSVTAWLRQAERVAAGIECQPWDRDGFADALTAQLRPLTRVKDPALFLPRLVAVCAEVGVAIVVLRAPKGCTASGAARFLDANKAMITLSARHLSDDHLWFTLFHEAAHLLLHDESTVFVDDLTPSSSPPKSLHEQEADAFASDTLLPVHWRQELTTGRPTAQRVLRLAHDAGVAPGIAVGQLQHTGILGYNNLNALKRRYRWVNANLEMA